MARDLYRITDAASACRFLESLHAEGLLWHPEDDAADCLRSSGLGSADLAALDAAMAATFDFLPDPCDVALALSASPLQATVN